MILYPFPPGAALKCGIAGFDEEKREPAAELYLLAPGAVPPAEFDGGYLFCEAPGCRDTRLLQPVQTAAPDAPAVWCDTQVSGGSLEGYLRGLLPVWGDRLWVYLAPIRMLFPVPCPSGVGTPLDETAADALTAPIAFLPGACLPLLLFPGRRRGRARLPVRHGEDLPGKAEPPAKARCAPGIWGDSADIRKP